MEEIAPRALSRALELRRFSDPGLIEATAPVDMVAYRCLRSLHASFGSSHPESMPSGPFRVPGYLVCLHGRRYIQPLLLASACDHRLSEAVMELKVPAGTPALWIAGSGNPSTVNGADLICLDHVAINLIGWREEFATTIVEFEVRSG